MVNVREFTGGDFIRFAAGTNGVPTLLSGAFTVVAIVKRLSGHTDQGPIIDIASGLGGSRGLFRYTDDNVINYLRGQFQSAGDGPSWTSSDNWCAIVWRKGTGETNVRYSKGVKGSSSTSWTHNTTSGTVDTDGITCDRIQTRFLEDADWAARMRVAALAIFNTNLADGTVESIDHSYPEILAAGPIWAVKFDQASTGTSVTDDIGNGDQAALTGSSVITNDDPPNWVYEEVSEDQELDVGFHQQTTSIFPFSIENQTAQDLNLNRLESSLQFFDTTIENQSSQNLDLSRLEPTLQLFQPTLDIGDQFLFPARIESTLQFFTPTLELQIVQSLSIPHIETTSQLFAVTIVNQNNLDLNVNFKTSGVVLFKPRILNEGDELFEPTLLGNGSLADQIMSGLIDQGFLTGSLADREYARLLAKLALNYSDSFTIQDLYFMADEPNRLAGLVELV